MSKTYRYTVAMGPTVMPVDEHAYQMVEPPRKHVVFGASVKYHGCNDQVFLRIDNEHGVTVFSAQAHTVLYVKASTNRPTHEVELKIVK